MGRPRLGQPGGVEHRAPPSGGRGVANLCVPYLAEGWRSGVVPLVDRTLYPEDKFPAGQWDYQLFYEEKLRPACAAFEANVRATVKALFREGDPAGKASRRRTCVRARGGWFGGARRPTCRAMPTC